MALRDDLRLCLARSSAALALVLAASVAVLATALASQYVGGLEPCVLCLYQRVPYALAIALTGAGLLVSVRAGGRHPRLLAGVLAVSAAIFLAGAGIAAFHVGVEQGWWAGTESCTGPDLATMTAAQVRDYLLQAPIVRCDEVAWSLFGISMAGYNLAVSLGLSGACLALARAAARSDRKVALP